MPPRRRAGAQTAAVRADLEQLPVELRGCAEAEAAVALGRNIDGGIQVTASVKELRATLAALRARALVIAGPVAPPVSEKGGSPVVQLADRIAAARRGTAAG